MSTSLSWRSIAFTSPSGSGKPISRRNGRLTAPWISERRHHESQVLLFEQGQAGRAVPVQHRGRGREDQGNEGQGRRCRGGRRGRCGGRVPLLPRGPDGSSRVGAGGLRHEG